MNDKTSDLLASLQEVFNTECGGRLSVSAHNPATGELLEIDPDYSFSSASVIKVPVLVALYAQRDLGRLDLDEVLPVKQSDIVGGSGVLQEMHVGLPVTLRDLAHLMIVVSDNTATNMLIERIDVTFIHQMMRDLGFANIRIERKLMDLEARDRGLDNRLAAGDTRELFEKILLGPLPPLTDESRAQCIEIMKRQQHGEKLLGLLPEETKAAHKPGGLSDISHDAGIVFLPDGGWYSVAIFSGGFTSSKVAGRTLAKLSRMIWDHFTGG